MRSSGFVLSALFASLFTGCLSHHKAPYESDPLLLHYKPTLNDSATILAEQQARRGPAKPPMPMPSRDALLEAKAEAPPRIDPIQQIKTEKPAPLPPPTYGPTSATPLPPPGTPPLTPESTLPQRPQPRTVADASPLPPPAETKAEAPAPAKAPEKKIDLAGRPSAEGYYGHDDGYHWLQGVLECHYRGYYCIRFCDPSVEDQYGGKFRLEDDPRLAAFGEGDVIGVKGQIMQVRGGERQPRFFIHDAWLVHAK